MEDLRHLSHDEYERTRNQRRLDNRLDDDDVSDALQLWLLQHVDSYIIRVIARDVAAVEHGGGATFGTSGGSGYTDVVTVYYRGLTQTQSWTWRHQFDQKRDRFDLRVMGFGECSIERRDDHTLVHVDILNMDGQYRTATFSFNGDSTPAVYPGVLLSAREQSAFHALVNKDALRRLDERKSKGVIDGVQPSIDTPAGVRAGTGQTQRTNDQPHAGAMFEKYSKPYIRQRVMNLDFGIGAFVIQEQIGHRVRDPQVRLTLYAMKHGDDHSGLMKMSDGYQSESGAMLRIIHITPNSVVVKTHKGTEVVYV